MKEKRFLKTAICVICVALVFPLVSCGDETVYYGEQGTVTFVYTKEHGYCTLFNPKRRSGEIKGLAYMSYEHEIDIDEVDSLRKELKDSPDDIEAIFKLVEMLDAFYAVRHGNIYEKKEVLQELYGVLEEFDAGNLDDDAKNIISANRLLVPILLDQKLDDVSKIMKLINAMYEIGYISEYEWVKLNRSLPERTEKDFDELVEDMVEDISDVLDEVFDKLDERFDELFEMVEIEKIGKYGKYFMVDATTFF